MTAPLLFHTEPHPLAEPLARALSAEAGRLEQRRFPDGESYLRIRTDVSDRDCIVLAPLVDPNARYLPLLFLLDTLRELGASRIGLIAPYLPYMRQDRRFNPGEAVNARLFATDLSRHIDWLVTVDPHLHRIHKLEEVYRVPATAVSAMPALADWLGTVGEAVLVGPDAESEQWVAALAEASGLPYVIGRKERLGDRAVRVHLPVERLDPACPAIIVDDVISSGHTLLDCIAALKQAGVTAIDALAVHGLFADHADRTLQRAGLRRLVTTNCIQHDTNAVDMTALVVSAVQAIGSTAR